MEEIFVQGTCKGRIKSAVSPSKIPTRLTVWSLPLFSKTWVTQEAICFEKKTKKFTTANLPNSKRVT